jgi:hypothetical protein
LTKSTSYVLKSSCCAFRLLCPPCFHSPRSVLTYLACRRQLPDLIPGFHLNSNGRELWLCAYVTGFLAVLHPGSNLNTLDNVQRVTGRFLGSPTKIMSTAGYATKHIPSLIALPRTLKAPNRHLTEAQSNSFRLMESEVVRG